MSQTDVLPAPELEPLVCKTGKWEQERSAYWRLPPSLLPQYRNQYVAVHDGRVVDSGTDQVELALRVYQRFGYVPIYVGLVCDEPVQTAGPRRIKPASNNTGRASTASRDRIT